MKDYNYYRTHNKEAYDNEDIKLDCKPKESILLHCIECKQTYTNAYKCQNTKCLFYLLKKDWMKRPHTCSKEFLELRKNINHI